MKRTLSAFITLVYTLLSFSQVKNGNELIAEGIAIIKIKPDLAHFQITVTKDNTIEKTAIKELNEEVEKLQNILIKLGFTEKNIRIADYNISKNDYDNRNEYTATNILSIDFVLDNKIIESFYQEIQNKNSQDLQIEFTTKISDILEKNTRQKLVLISIENAKENAENIAKALNVKLNSIKRVYKHREDLDSFSNLKIDNVKFVKPIAAKADEIINPKTSFDRYEVTEVEFNESITIVYEIVN